MYNRRAPSPAPTGALPFDATRLLVASLCAFALGCANYMEAGAVDPATDTDDASNVVDARTGSGGGTGAPAPDAAVAGSPLTGDQLSNEAITELLRGSRYRGTGYRQVNKVAFPSTVSPDKTVILWISEDAYDTFKEVSPDQAGSKVSLPVGSVIVREVLKNAKLDAITVMLRLPTGSFPLGGDWWYASATPDGTIKTDAATGAPLVGLLENCGTCHLRRRDDDHLFGAPSSYLDP